jgi:hypothetical protein
MPTTRRGQTASTSEHSTSKSTLSAEAKGKTDLEITRASSEPIPSASCLLTAFNPGTGLSKVTHYPDDQTYAPADRAAKRRRTETLNKDTSSADAPNGELPSHPGGANELPASQKIDDSLRDLTAQSTAHSQQDGPSFENGAASADTFSQLDPDMTKAISDIIDHSERFEQYCAIGASDDAESPGSKGLVFAKTGSRMKVESLSILDNLVSS